MIEASGARGGLFGAGGRFKGGTDPIMEKFNESLSFDKRYVHILLLQYVHHYDLTDIHINVPNVNV